MQTGAPGLDTILGGGLQRRQTAVVTGDPGSGKTVLCAQIACEQARNGACVVFATVTSESHDKLLSSLERFSFFDKSLIGDRLFLLSAYPSLKSGPKEARDVLLKTIRERKATLLVVDGFRSVRDLWANEATVRDFLYELSVGLDVSGCAALITTEYRLQRLLELPEATNIDGIIELSTEERGNDVVRRARVVKLRGQRHAMGKHVMRITESGVQVFPRLESEPCAHPDLKSSQARASFGIEELDKLLAGGVPSGSATLVAGSSGIGKTLLSLFFAAAGAKSAEPSYVLSLNETPNALVARARRLGLDLEPLIAKKLIRIEYRSPVDVEADELIDHVYATLSATKARRFVMDGVDEFQGTLTEQERLPHFLTAMTVRLRTQGVTSMFLKKISKVVGSELDFGNTPISTITENLLLMRFVEMKGELHRVLSILNVRDSDFDRNLREFTMADGFRVLEPIRSAEGLLTGVGWPSSSGRTVDR